MRVVFISVRSRVVLPFLCITSFRLKRIQNRLNAFTVSLFVGRCLPLKCRPLENTINWMKRNDFFFWEISIIELCPNFYQEIEIIIPRNVQSKRLINLYTMKHLRLLTAFNMFMMCLLNVSSGFKIAKTCDFR